GCAVVAVRTGLALLTVLAVVTGVAGVALVTLLTGGTVVPLVTLVALLTGCSVLAVLSVLAGRTVVALVALRTVLAVLAGGAVADDDRLLDAGELDDPATLEALTGFAGRRRGDRCGDARTVSAGEALRPSCSRRSGGTRIALSASSAVRAVAARSAV